MALTIVPPVREASEAGEVSLDVIGDPLLNEEGLFVSGGAVKAGGAIVRFTTEESPGLEDPTPTLVGKGFGGSEAAYARFRSELAKNGNAVTTYKTPRTFGDPNPERMQSKAMWAVAKRLGKIADTFEVDLVNHSASAWTGANVALRNPQAIRNLVIVGGAGLIDHNMITLAPGAVQLATNVVRSVPRFLELGYSWHDAKEVARHNLINPIRSIGEMAVASGCKSRDILPQLSLLGVNITIIQFENDELFDTTKVEQFAAESGINIVVLPKMGHAAPILYPEEVAAAVDDVLKA